MCGLRSSSGHNTEMNSLCTHRKSSSCRSAQSLRWLRYLLIHLRHKCLWYENRYCYLYQKLFGAPYPNTRDVIVSKNEEEKRREEKGREGKGRKGEGREGKRREEKRRVEKGREGKRREVRRGEERRGEEKSREERKKENKKRKERANQDAITVSKQLERRYVTGSLSIHTQVRNSCRPTHQLNGVRIISLSLSLSLSQVCKLSKPEDEPSISPSVAVWNAWSSTYTQHMHTSK